MKFYWINPGGAEGLTIVGGPLVYEGSDGISVFTSTGERFCTAAPGYTIEDFETAINKSLIAQRLLRGGDAVVTVERKEVKNG